MSVASKTQLAVAAWWPGKRFSASRVQFTGNPDN